MVGTKTVVIIKLKGGMVQRIVSNDEVDVFVLDNDLNYEPEDVVRAAIEDKLPSETQLIDHTNLMDTLSEIAE
jgi:hypothetical protein